MKYKTIMSNEIAMAILLDGTINTISVWIDIDHICANGCPDCEQIIVDMDAITRAMQYNIQMLIAIVIWPSRFY